MQIKQLVLTSTLALTLLGVSIASAHQPTVQIAPPHGQQQHCHNKFGHLLTSEERQQLHALLNDMRQQMKPLVKEKRALKLQLMGKLATPNTQWTDIAPLVDKINNNHAKITTLFAKTQLKAFQSMGVLLPKRHGKRFNHHRNH